MDHIEYHLHVAFVKKNDVRREEPLTWVYIAPDVRSISEQAFGMKMNTTNPEMAQIMEKSPIWTALGKR